jgi:polysaccharide biosynthesis/export protein
MTTTRSRPGSPCSSRRSLLPLLLVAGLALALGPAAQAQEYVIGARDVLKVTVWGQEDLSKDYPVDPDGFVSFPLIGRVKAMGLTPTAFAGELRSRLEKDYLVNPQVLISVKDYLSQKVHVGGEADKPGVFYLSGPTTVRDILLRAGGPSKSAGSQILVVRAQGLQASAGKNPEAGTLRLDVARVLAGDPAENVALSDGDTIVVPKGNTFYVFGEVKKPGAYQLDKETNVLEGITLAGGFTDKAAPGRVSVIRSAGAGQEVLSVDMNDVIKRGQRDKAIRLRENDVVVVPESFF